jgi:excisionase family DNA binding protein
MTLSATTARVWWTISAALFVFAILFSAVSGVQAEEPAPLAPEVLTLNEAATLLRISPDQLERLAERNEVPGRRIGSGWRFNRAALLAWLNGDWHLIATVKAPDATQHATPEVAQPILPVMAPPLTSREKAQVTGAGTMQLAQAPTDQENDQGDDQDLAQEADALPATDFQYIELEPEDRQPTADAPASEVSEAEASATEAPGGDAPIGEAPQERQPTADAPASEVSEAEASATEAPGGDAPIGEAPQERTAESIFLRGQKVLLAPGEVTMDFGLFFSRNDNQTLAAAGSGIGFATIEQQTATAFILGRVGVLDETELFASTTYRNENNDVFLFNNKISGSSRTEFGDVRLGVRHTFLKEGPGRPNLIATLDGRIPTGDTSYAIGGGLALTKSIDPVVLFANANYRYTFSEDFADITRLEPEDRFDISLGYALSLNDTLTISTSVSGVFSSETNFGNVTLRQQDTYSLSFGLTSWLAEGLYIEPTVSPGWPRVFTSNQR